MKILIIHNLYQQPGGEDQVVQHETELLRSHGHKVVHYFRSNSEMIDHSKVGAALDSIWSRSACRDLADMIDKEKPEIAHFHNVFFKISPAAYRVCADKNLAVVQTLHNYRLMCVKGTFLRNGKECFQCLGKKIPWQGIAFGCYRNSKMESALLTGNILFHRLNRTWTSKVHQWIVLSNYAKSIYESAGWPAHKIDVKPNFLFEDPGAAQGDGKGAVFVGRLSEEKGISTLLNAWAQLPDIPLKIVGDGPLMQWAELEIRSRKITNVFLQGALSRDEALKVIRDSKVVIFPSIFHEPFGMVLLEAMALGKPVIASNIRPITDIVSNEGNPWGLLFAVGMENELTARVKEISLNAELAQVYGQRARNLFETKYSASGNYKKLIQIYENALKIKNSVETEVNV